MIYRLKKYLRWLGEFGLPGLWLLLRLDSLDPRREVVLRSRRFGPLHCRACLEDFEAINTVICFEAYGGWRPDWPGGSVLDLGANIGIATRYFLVAFPRLEVLAIEPSEANCALFERNMAATPERDRVRLIRGAVGPQAGVGRLVSDAAGRFDSFSVDFSPTASAGADGVVVHAMEDLLKDLPRPVLVKMDIEGGEEVMLSARAKWDHAVERMMIEFHGAEMEARWIETLRREGWECKKQFDTWHFFRGG